MDLGAWVEREYREAARRAELERRIRTGRLRNSVWSPHHSNLLRESNIGSVGDATPGTAVTTGAAAATKGSWAELIASTAFDAYWVDVFASNYSTAVTASEGAMDLGIGAATEEVLIENMLMGQAPLFTVAACTPKQWSFPLYIPAGSRLTARAAGARVSTAMQVWVVLYGGTDEPWWPYGTKVTTYGMGTVPNGTAITPGASGAEGAYAQLTASTSEDHFAFVPSFQTSADTTTNIRTLYVELGLGAATEESATWDWLFGTNADECTFGPFNAMPCWRDVPSGTRLAMRASNSGTNDGAYNGVIHALS